jgi:hypothetical protein
MKQKFLSVIFVGLYLFVFILNFINNNLESKNTKFRDFEYSTWKDLTRNTQMFDQVNSRDFMIARNQNDAYEYNAATFYKNTGKRLAYFYKAEIIYPEIEKCKSSTACVLTNPKPISIQTLSNLNRIKDPSPQDIERDWVVNNMFSPKTKLASVWATDLIKLNEDNIFSYLIKFDDASDSAILDPLTFKSYLRTKGKVDFKPLFANQCLKYLRSFSSKLDENYTISEWTIPLNTKTKYKGNFIGYEETHVGIC